MSSLIQYNRVLGFVLCSTEDCGHVIEVVNVCRHLKSAHEFIASEAAQKHCRVQAEADSSKECVGQALRDKYLYASDTTAANIKDPLPSIPLLPVQDCLRCPGCGYLCVAENTLKKHMRVHHPGISKKPTTITGIHAQRLYAGKKLKYFPVFSEVLFRNPVLLSMLSMSGSTPSGTCTADVKFMDSFLSEMRFDEYLFDKSLSEEEAFCFVDWDNCERALSIRKLLSRYLKRAFDTARRKPYIRAHDFLDRKLSLAVDVATISRYESALNRLLFFFIRVCRRPNKLSQFVPDAVLEATAQLQTVCSLQTDQENNGLSLLHSILCSTFFDPLSSCQEILPLFVTCSSVVQTRNSKNYRYVLASELSPVLAALKHLARCVVVTDVYLYNERQSAARWDWIQQATTSNVDTGVQYVEHVLKVSNYIRSAETQQIRFIVCPNHALCGILDDNEIPVSVLGDKMKQLQRDAWHYFREHLLLSFEPTTELWRDFEKMQDALREKSPTFRFASHSASKPITTLWQARLFHELQSSFMNADGTILAPATNNYLRHCQQLQSILLILLQVCSGAPARATEVGSIQVRNTPHATRHIFLLKGRLFTVTSYHKSRSLQEGRGKPIPRFPDKVTARLVLVYLVLVKPLETALQKALRKEDNDFENGANFHFTADGEPAAADILRSRFSNTMKSVGIPLNTSQYRQYHAGVVKTFMNAAQTLEIDQPTVLHWRAAHTSTTAHNLYGISDLDLRNLTSSEMEAHRVAAEAWHRLLGIESGAHLSFEGDQIDVSIKYQGNGPEQNELQPNISSAQAICEKLACTHAKVEENRTLLKSVISLLNETSSENESNGKRKREKIFGVSDGSPEKKQRFVKEHDDELLLGLRRLLRSEVAVFLSREQEDAVRAAWKGENDALIVLGTGSGKTLVFMLPCYLEIDKTFIIVVPLVALQADLLRKCRVAGIDVVQFSDCNQLNAGIVVVSPEHTQTKAYESFVKTRAALGQIHAIFIDKCHLVSLWKHFRHCLREIRTHVRPTGVSCPVIALTATAPPNAQEDIALDCGLVNLRLIRTSTSRANIQYSVVDEPEQNLYISAVQQLRSLFVENRTAPTHYIVYTRTVKFCEDTGNLLRLMLSKEALVSMYHGRLSKKDKDRSFAVWLQRGDDKKPFIVVATSAFGCGIDVPTIRAVLHVQRPDTLVEFIQESGRAGRDGNPAKSIFFNVAMSKSACTERMDSPRADVPFLPDFDVPSDSKSFEFQNKFGALNSFSGSSMTCRRWILDKVADGAVHEVCCSARNMALCDVCAKQSPAYKARSNNTQSPNFLRATSQQESFAGSLSTPNSLQVGEAENSLRSSFQNSSEQTSQELMLLGAKYEDLCPVCSLSKHHPVRHKELLPSCMRGRCLKCRLFGPNAEKCPYIRKESPWVGCYQCSLNKLDGCNIHRPDTFGKKSCSIKVFLSCCLVAWADNSTRGRLQDQVPSKR